MVDLQEKYHELETGLKTYDDDNEEAQEEAAPTEEE